MTTGSRTTVPLADDLFRRGQGRGSCWEPRRGQGARGAPVTAHTGIRGPRTIRRSPQSATSHLLSSSSPGLPRRRTQQKTRSEKDAPSPRRHTQSGPGRGGDVPANVPRVPWGICGSHNGRNKAASRGRTNGRKASEVKGGLGASVQKVLTLQNPETEATCRKTATQAVCQRPCRPVSPHWLCHTLPSLPVVTREADAPV